MRRSTPKTGRGRHRCIQGSRDPFQDVPKPVIDRRFSKGWRNFENVYRDLVDYWKLYDNAGSTPVLLAEGGGR